MITDGSRETSPAKLRNTRPVRTTDDATAIEQARLIGTLLRRAASDNKFSAIFLTLLFQSLDGSRYELRRTARSHHDR